MIVYTMIGTSDLDRAKKFYEPIFRTLGLETCWQDESSVSYGKPDDVYFPRFFIGYPFDGGEYSVGNGTMTAFHCGEPSRVDQAYELAMSAGAQSEGEPGYRPQYGEGFYAAYVRDPDGNKLAFVVY